MLFLSQTSPGRDFVYKMQSAADSDVMSLVLQVFGHKPVLEEKPGDL